MEKKSNQELNSKELPKKDIIKLSIFKAMLIKKPIPELKVLNHQYQCQH